MSDQYQLENKTAPPGTPDTSANQKVTSIEKKRKPKDPGRVAAGKKTCNVKQKKDVKKAKRKRCRKKKKAKLMMKIKCHILNPQALNSSAFSSQCYRFSGWIVSQKKR